MKSEFEKWFIAQFGKRPKKVNMKKMLESLKQFHQLHDLLNEGVFWDTKFDACLKSWNAKSFKRKELQ